MPDELRASDRRKDSRYVWTSRVRRSFGRMAAVANSVKRRWSRIELHTFTMDTCFFLFVCIRGGTTAYRAAAVGGWIHSITTGGHK
jgi:hypothetical protein